MTNSDLFSLGNIISKDELVALNYLLDLYQSRLDLTELHGFLTAIISSPTLIPPSVWQDEIFKEDFIFESEEDFFEVITLLFRFNNYVSSCLHDNDGFDLLLFENGEFKTLQSASQKCIGTWCRGYTLGVGFSADIWVEHKLATNALSLIGILSGDIELTDVENSDKLTELADPARLPSIVTLIYQYWLEQKHDIKTKHNQQRKLGRNDPCYCGSGKKFKKCCYTDVTLIH